MQRYSAYFLPEIPRNNENESMNTLKWVGTIFKKIPKNSDCICK